MDNIKATLDLLEKFLLGLGAPEWLAEIVIFVLTGAVLLGLVAYSGHWLYSKIAFYLNRRRLSRDLHPFYTKTEIDKATRYYIPTKYQDTAPSQADEPSRSFIDSPKAKLIPMMLKTAFQQDDSRYYLILADSGMGKTTFMMNLFLAYKNQWPWKQKHDIRLLPLGHPQTLAEVEKIDKPEHTILLLDALDEDVEAVKDYKKRLGEILEKTWKFREVVITCRTQFFPSEVEEPSKTGYFRYGMDGGEHFFRKAYVSVFDEKDINRYLRKRFKFWQWKDRKKARRIVQKSPNLMVRPMLLSHIQDLVGEEREYEYTYQIYEVLIQKWVERESNKPGIAEKYGSRENFQKLLLEFSQALAVDLYENREKREGRLSIYKDEQLISIDGLQLSDFESIDETWGESDWRSKSLLNRDANGWYKFSHKSIFEYFLSIAILDEKINYYNVELTGMNFSKVFLSELFLKRLTIMSEAGNIKFAKNGVALSVNSSDYKNIFISDSIELKDCRILSPPFIINNLPANIRTVNISDDKTKMDVNYFFVLYFYYYLFVAKKTLWSHLIISILSFEILKNIEEINSSMNQFNSKNTYAFPLMITRLKKELNAHKLEQRDNIRFAERRFRNDESVFRAEGNLMVDLDHVKFLLKAIENIETIEMYSYLNDILTRNSDIIQKVTKGWFITLNSFGQKKRKLIEINNETKDSVLSRFGFISLQEFSINSDLKVNF